MAKKLRGLLSVRAWMAAKTLKNAHAISGIESC